MFGPVIIIADCLPNLFALALREGRITNLHVRFRNDVFAQVVFSVRLQDDKPLAHLQRFSEGFLAVKKSAQNGRA